MSLGPFNPVYTAARLARRFLPAWAAERFLSRRYLPIAKIYETTKLYLRGMTSVGLDETFRKGNGLTVMEVGTGVYNPATAPFIMSGVERLLLLEPFAEGKIDHRRFQERFNALLDLAVKDDTYPLPKTERKAGGPGTSISGFPPGVELLACLWEETGLPSDSIDVIFSASVLEHLRDPKAALSESARILRSGGWMIHVVDLRDHFFRYPFEMLKFSERTWRFLTTSSGGSGRQNRLRLTHWKNELKLNGFRTEVIVLTDLSSQLAREKPSFAPEFRDLPDDDLKVGRAILVSQKTGPGPGA